MMLPSDIVLIQDSNPILRPSRNAYDKEWMCAGIHQVRCFRKEAPLLALYCDSAEDREFRKYVEIYAKASR